jgi:membrane protease YdiL (CAAX protease family)
VTQLAPVGDCYSPRYSSKSCDWSQFGRLSPAVPPWLLLPSLLALSLAVIPAVTGVTLTQLGLRPWREWSATEKSYFVQVVIIANVVFLAVFAGRIATRMEQPGFALGVWNEFVPCLAFGFYQELFYRGLIQVEAERRWGPVVGVVRREPGVHVRPAALEHFSSPASAAVPMFASIFAIGLLFGAVYQRSRNLWLVAVFHAIGNAWMLWGPDHPLKPGGTVPYGHPIGAVARAPERR